MIRLASFLALAVLVGCASDAGTQEVRMVEVEGRSVRVWAAGLEDLESTRPIVVFEAGFMFGGTGIRFKEDHPDQDASNLSGETEFAFTLGFDVLLGLRFP